MKAAAFITPLTTPSTHTTKSSASEMTKTSSFSYSFSDESLQFPGEKFQKL